MATAGDLVLDATRHSAHVGDLHIDLSPTEFRLATLMAAGGTLVSRRDLVRAAWPDGAQVSDNTLDQYLSRLRRKLPHHDPRDRTPPVVNRLARHLAPRTLRGRLSLVALTTAALLMTVLTVVFNTVMDRHLQDQAADQLRNRAAAVATTIDTSGPRVRVLETVNDRLLDANTCIYTGTRQLEKPPSATADSALAQAADRLTARGRPVGASVHTDNPRFVRLCSQPVSGLRSTATVITAAGLPLTATPPPPCCRLR